jgi:hypothetical protein
LDVQADIAAARRSNRPEVTLERVADHLMAVLWPVVRDLPKRATMST